MEMLKQLLKVSGTSREDSRQLSINFVVNNGAKKQSLVIPITTMARVYTLIKSKVSPTNTFYNNFCMNGLAICDKEISEGNANITASPHVFSVLSSISEDLGLDLDIPIPSVIGMKMGYTRDTDMFLWDTVPIEWMSEFQKDWIFTYLSGAKDLGRKSETGDVAVARKFIHMEESAHKRKIDFTISLSDLKEVMTAETCYFSGEPLVSYRHDSSKVRSGDLTLPHNYLTIDRLDNTKGYVPGNIVACSKAVNDIKADMTVESFTPIAEELKTLIGKGYSKKQLATLSRLLVSTYK